MLLPEEKMKKNFKKTGTTIVGLQFKDGVIIAADTRATAGNVAEKNIQKIHVITKKIALCGAGTAADNDYVAKKLSAQLELMERNTGRTTDFKTLLCRVSNDLFRYGGHIGCYYIFGGFDSKGSHLVQVSANGYIQYSPFLAMGSGSLNADAELQYGYKDDLSLDEAKDLAIKAITAGILYDLGSGSNVDLMIVTKDGMQLLRNHKIIGKKETMIEQTFKIIPRNLVVLKEEKLVFESDDKKTEMEIEN